MREAGGMAVRAKRDMPEGFEAEINVSQTILKEKYGTSTYVIQRWKREAGKIRKEQTMCDYRQNIICNGSDKAKCAKCGWNPEEEGKINAMLHSDGIEAVRKYIAARERKILAEKEGVNT